MTKISGQTIELMKSWAVNMLFPRTCPVCGKIVDSRKIDKQMYSGLICQSCRNKLSFITQPTCKKCGKELESEQAEYCFDCTRHHRSFEFGLALLNYDDISSASMAKIKYKNKREYLDFYAEAILRNYKKQILRMHAQVLIPVPVHPHRYRTRGYNQAGILAKKIGEQLDIPVLEHVLVRNKNTAPQKQLDPAGRLKNLEEAFECPENIGHLSSIILIDDIYTTGSTMEACTRALLKAGAGKVYCLVICIGHGR